MLTIWVVYGVKNYAIDLKSFLSEEVARNYEESIIYEYDYTGVEKQEIKF
jgi:hypothetical protein